MIPRVSVSMGNSKIGKIPNISLPPLVTCRSDAPCRSDCYALKSHRLYRSVEAVWKANLLAYLANPFLFFEDVAWQIYRRKAPYFRWMVGGDIPDEAFFLGILKVCRETPGTSHLLFTKRYDLDLNLSDIPANLNLLFSLWPGLPQPEKILPFRKAHYLAKNAAVVPSGVRLCSHYCPTCLYCWQNKGDVAFRHH